MIRRNRAKMREEEKNKSDREGGTEEACVNSKT